MKIVRCLLSREDRGFRANPLLCLRVLKYDRTGMSCVQTVTSYGDVETASGSDVGGKTIVNNVATNGSQA